jgi:hypothetical protein
MDSYINEDVQYIPWDSWECETFLSLLFLFEIYMYYLVSLGKLTNFFAWEYVDIRYWDVCKDVGSNCRACPDLCS